MACDWESVYAELVDVCEQAVEDIRMLGRMGANICPVCAHHNHGEGDKQKCVGCIMKWDTDNFEWRGIAKKEG